MMREKGWDAVVITGSDPHGSEYPAPRWKQVEWLSGFTGEAGDLVITMDHAGLWTDTRYFIQAINELQGSGIELHKTRVPEEVPIPQWLSSGVLDVEEDALPTVAIDGLCQGNAAVDAMVDAFGGEVNIVDVPDMLSPLWTGRPPVPSSPVITLGDDQAGESREQKLRWMRKFLIRKGCDAILIPSLDEIAWILNVRGSDVEYNPVVVSYLLITMDGAFWYVKKDGFPSGDQETYDSYYELSADGVRVLRYDEVSLMLAGLTDVGEVESVYVDPSTLNYNMFRTLLSGPLGNSVVTGPSPVPLRKAVKNAVEIDGMREAHLEDGIAMETFLYGLETRISAGEAVSEADAAASLDALRSRIPGYRGNSFKTISAYGPNAALPHYTTPESGSAVLRPEGLYLVDSGGQYIFGTTDITRTVPLGPCSPLEREDYTLVLKGHIDLAMAVFPKGTAGCQLDVLARNPLWRAKRNFGHGTGHGVGFFLCVHEGPQDIRQNFNSTPLLPGMITSDEPGIYREGLHGIRHENLLLCRDEGRNDFGQWLGFETLTLCHYDTSIIVAELLTDAERDWLNAYNASVYERLSPRLPSHIALWLKAKCRPV